MIADGLADLLCARQHCAWWARTSAGKFGEGRERPAQAGGRRAAVTGGWGGMNVDGWKRENTHLSTAGRVLESTAASSFSRCGRFPVFSSCSMTPTTMSSSIPCVSILKPLVAPGEGGGVCCATRDRSPSCFTTFGRDDGCDEGRGGGGEAEDAADDEWDEVVWERFVRFAGGSEGSSVDGSSLMAAGGER